MNTMNFMMATLWFKSSLSLGQTGGGGDGINACDAAAAADDDDEGSNNNITVVPRLLLLSMIGKLLMPNWEHRKWQCHYLSQS